MNWPWRQRGNRHAWSGVRVGRIANGDPADGVYWICEQCGAFDQGCDEYFNPLPEFGCTALPLPTSAPTPDTADLPIVGEGG